MIKDVLRDYVLFNGADRMVGRVDSFKPPSLQRTVEQFRAGGMDGKIPIDMGLEALESSWVTSGIDRGMYTGFGLIMGVRTTVQVRGAVVDPVTGLPKSVQHTMIGDITGIDPGEWKAGERATLSVSMQLAYYKLTHTLPGVPAIEIDLINGIRIINGVDQLIAVRALIGR